MKKDQLSTSFFLSGKYVYLRPPDIEKDVYNGKWTYWFNDRNVTRYIRHGVFPNTIEKQAEFVRSAMSDNSKVLLCIIDRSNNTHMGVISFIGIDLINRKAEIGIVIGEKEYPPAAPLEAMALMTEYGFERLNLNKINAGQCTELWPWVNSLELIGYKIEGYGRGTLIKNGRIYDQFHTGITADDYFKLKKERKNKLATSDPAKLLALLSKEDKTEEIKRFFESMYE